MGAVNEPGLSVESAGPTADSGLRLRVGGLAARDPKAVREAIVRAILATATVVSAASVLLVALFVLRSGIPALMQQGWGFLTQGGWDYDLATAWESAEGVLFGARPLLAGTVLTTGFALLATLLLGTGTAIFIAELAPRWMSGPIESVVQLLAGVPSVVFGIVGISVVVPFVTRYIVPENSWEVVPDIPIDGASLLAGVIVLSMMIMPFYVSVSVDALRSIPRSYIAGGLAMGLSKWRTISRIQLPAATSGLLAGLVLAAARGVGEAIALSMVAGSLASTPSLANGPLYFLLAPVRTMASAIVETGGEAMSIEVIQGVLFGLASVLLAFSLALSLSARLAFSMFARRVNTEGSR